MSKIQFGTGMEGGVWDAAQTRIWNSIISFHIQRVDLILIETYSCYANPAIGPNQIKLVEWIDYQWVLSDAPLSFDCVPEHRAPLKLSGGQPHDSAFAAPHPDLDELRFEVHYVQEVVYLFAIVPLVLTVFLTHSVRVLNRELLKSFLGLDENLTHTSFEQDW